MVLALLLTAHADDSFTLMKETEACTIRKREKTETQGAAMWARCRWPELEPAVVRGMLTDLTRYDEWIWPIGESRVEREDAGRKLVYQRQHIFGLSDREVLLWVTVDDRPELAKVAWTAANDQPLVLADGAVRTPRNTGFWTIGPNPDGPGTEVVHQIELDAGGLPLPQWLVRAIQTRGFHRILTDIRGLAATQPGQPSAR
ncbi:MAG: hypothetical protein H6736_06410 [Alphaproteobacteria bacterium]|nr:hypothetical protein [Alphaproteobacteria bacterium]